MQSVRMLNYEYMYMLNMRDASNPTYDSIIYDNMQWQINKTWQLIIKPIMQK